MKTILFTQRVDVIESYNERRDCADQNIAKLLYACGYVPIPIVNKVEIAKDILKEIQPTGILLTGGNDLSKYGGCAPERDETEQELIHYALLHDIPVLGICRGLQIIADYFGNEIEPVENHVRVKHGIYGEINRTGVNSFHNMGVKTLKKPMIEMARSSDGVIEAIIHEKKRIFAIMWHPERVNPYDEEDIDLIRRFFDGGMHL